MVFQRACVGVSQAVPRTSNGPLRAQSNGIFSISGVFCDVRCALIIGDMIVS
ncbi:MAG: hypothetical protein IKP25_06865 [Ruminococcus sp.]|nr:hypothetical protein [Ruminococcus sp.]